MFVDHIPFAPPRDGTPGEGIYLKLWQDFVAARPDDFEDIFRDMNDPVDQRVASIAASFMVFMGCNGGASFTYQANELRPKFAYPAHAFAAAWAIENQRSRGTNHGLRTAEYMLAAIHPIGNDGFRSDVVWERVPQINQKDMDAIECMVEWWSTRPAERMREIAEALIAAENKKRLSGLFTVTTNQRGGD
jgi:hypothetical protein